MIVLVIMSLVLGLTGPRISNQMSLLHLRTTAKQVAAGLRWARSQALSTGKVYNAVFDCGEGRLILSDYAATSDTSELKIAENAGEPPVEAEPEDDPAARKPELKKFELPEDIFFTRIEIADVLDANPGRDSIYQMTFFPDGTSMGGEVSIADEQGRSFIVAVDFLTGIVSLEEPES